MQNKNNTTITIHDDDNNDDGDVADADDNDDADDYCDNNDDYFVALRVKFPLTNQVYQTA